MCNSRIQLLKWGEKVFPRSLAAELAIFCWKIVVGTGNESKGMTSVYLTALSISLFLQSILVHFTRSRLLCFRVKNVWRFGSKRVFRFFRKWDGKWRFWRRLGSYWCRRTNLTHLALTLGSEGNKRLEIPGVYCVFVQLSPLGDPATQYRLPFRTGLD